MCSISNQSSRAMLQGRIQDFHGAWGGGGAQKIITSAEPNSLSAGAQYPHKVPGSARVVLMLSRAIWALFLSILIKKIGLQNIVDPILGGGGGRLLQPPWIRHWCYVWKDELYRCAINEVGSDCISLTLMFHIKSWSHTCTCLYFIFFEKF